MELRQARISPNSQAAHALLLEPEEDVQYFGANLLFMKVDY
jgi:hypothetical protein|tara:strand:+ start:41 stop:163 length:123 start_codon:yes stop_codon:yes gene_type:complete